LHHASLRIPRAFVALCSPTRRRSILINVDGAGSQQHPVVLDKNELGSVTPHVFFICGKQFPGSAFNVLPGSIVVATSMPRPTQIEGLCP
jgi:hypothetical protein